MNLLMSRLRLYFGMLIWDILIDVTCVIALNAAFREMGRPWLRITLTIMITIFFAMAFIHRYQVLYRRYEIDDVTGGKNKKSFAHLVKRLIRSGDKYVMVYGNIDRFKLINNMYGFEIGDEILRKTHGIIDEEMRWDECSGHIMADNFGLCMRYHSIEKLDERLLRINRRVHGIGDKNGEPYGIIMNYGVYVINSERAYNVNALLERANIARGNITNTHLVPLGIYDKSIRKRLERERELELKMQRALEQHEFIPFLQPKFELRGETIAGAEALVRWVDSVEGMIYPDEFIPLFEKNGSITSLDLYMFEEVCKLIERWDMAGCRVVPISVNLSQAHFANPNFFDAYEKLIKEYKLPQGSVEFEFTESLLYENAIDINTLCERIRGLGFTSSIDDFGSGYSSLNMLKDVRVDTLKIDRVFFKDGDTNKRAKDIIGSVIGLAKALNLKTVSEGVEYREQVIFLKEMGCDYVQGYIYSKPMSIVAFERMVFFPQ